MIFKYIELSWRWKKHQEALYGKDGVSSIFGDGWK